MHITQFLTVALALFATSFALPCLSFALPCLSLTGGPPMDNPPVPQYMRDPATKLIQPTPFQAPLDLLDGSIVIKQPGGQWELTKSLGNKKITTNGGDLYPVNTQFIKTRRTWGRHVLWDLQLPAEPEPEPPQPPPTKRRRPPPTNPEPGPSGQRPPAKSKSTFESLFSFG